MSGPVRFTARRLPVHRGPAGWSEILGPLPPAQPFDQNATADVAVIGAGFAGLAAARRLHQLDPSLRVVVLDAGRVAEGAAGRNSGFMIDIPHELNSADYAGAGDDRRLMALNRQAQAFMAQAVEEYGISPDFFDRWGKINGAGSAKGEAANASFATHLDALGEAYEIYDAAQMAEITGSRYYRSGLYTPGTVMLQPAGIVRGLAEGLRRDGMAVCENSPVRGIERVGGGWRVQVGAAHLDAGRVILTVNGHLESFGVARGRLMQLFLYAVMTPELGPEALRDLGGLPRWGVTPSDPMGTTVRRIATGQGGNRIVTRTCATLRPGMQARAADLARAKRVMQRKFDARFPKLAGMAMGLGWAGHLCLSLNGVSVLDEVADGVVAGCVQNGLGTARGTLTGIGAADRALGQESEITRFFGTQAEPQKLPPEPFRQIGANAVLRYKEWHARRE